MLDFLRRKTWGRKLLNYYHLAMAVIANFLFGFPSRKLHVIGVTGTDGKTTTVNMIASIFRTGGFETAHLSTVNAQIGDKVFDTGLHTTTPSSFFLQRFLRRSVAAGCTHAVLETTSHALDQFRIYGIKFEVAVLTNISHEHLDYHKDLESYMAAKTRLFRNVDYRILNRDDASFQYFSGNSRGKLFSYGLNPKADIWANNIVEDMAGSGFTVYISENSRPVKLNIPGKFNIYNALAAIAVGKVYGLKSEVLSAGLENVKAVPGRMEMVTERVVVDFAHTPNALTELLRFFRPKISGQLIVVFGSAGERDQTKRPFMGQAADQFADVIILTREDNRSEAVENICAEIAAGIKSKQKGRNYFIILDRREAIRAALRQAQGANDLVVITGKGHEQSLNIDGKEVRWDDRAVVREELKNK